MKGNHVLKRLTGLVVIALCSMALTAGMAVAQTPTGDAYSGLAGAQQSAGGGGPDSGNGNGGVVTSNDTSSGGGGGGSLPFTGFELGMALLMGVGLVGSGFALRRTLRADARV